MEKYIIVSANFCQSVFEKGFLQDVRHNLWRILRMKLMISADIEGTCGICHWNETEKNHSDHEYFAKQMTKEVKAVCDGALETGNVDSVYIKDAHDSARNIIPEMLPEQITIMREWPGGPCSMMAGLEDCDAIAMTGYHSAAGTDGNPLAHTSNLQNVSVWLNGEVASEFMINTYYAAYFGKPVIFLSGDKALCESAKKICPEIETVAVSEGKAGASISIHPNVAVKRMYAGIQKALQKDLKAYKVKLPDYFRAEVQFKEIAKAQRGSFYPGARKSGPRSVAFESADYYEVARFFYFVL